MTKEELEKYIAETTKGIADQYIKDQLKEQAQDVVAKFKPATEDAKIEEPAKVNKFTSFRDFLTSVRKFRMNRDLDPRLVYVPGVAGKTAGHMEIGEDSQGGYGN
jgi:hypothetical protein